jgi:RHS repeat-associated protein
LLGAQDMTTGTQNQATDGLNESYSYDAFGNLQQSGNFNFIQAYTTANRISGYSYDTAGNLLADGLGNTYTWDANEMISSSNGTSYFYDAEGDRVGKSGSVPTDTIYFGGRPVARLTGGAWTDLIYGAGGLLAEVPGTQTGAPVYRMTDNLGSSVGTLTLTGALSGGIQDYAPFGELFNGSSTSDPYKFTGKERDTESGNDYFGARYYASTAGRWLSPDWSAKIEPVPYAKLADPQSLNLYAYVGNNPLRSADLDGHEPGISHQFDFMNCLDPEACPATEDSATQALKRYNAANSQQQGGACEAAACAAGAGAAAGASAPVSPRINVMSMMYDPYAIVSSTKHGAYILAKVSFVVTCSGSYACNNLNFLQTVTASYPGTYWQANVTFVDSDPKRNNFPFYFSVPEATARQSGPNEVGVNSILFEDMPGALLQKGGPAYFNATLRLVSVGSGNNVQTLHIITWGFTFDGSKMTMTPTTGVDQ